MLAKITARDFDLEKTLNSGQVFHWEKHGKGFVGTIGDSALYTEQRDERLLFSGVQARSDRGLFRARSSA